MTAIFVHHHADVQSQAIGPGTSIWQYCVVMAGARIGSNVTICAGCFVENDVQVGDNVTIKNGVQLWDGLRIEDGVFVGPNVTFANDPAADPMDRITLLKRGASVGANATIASGTTIGSGAMVGAGAVVTRSVPDNAIVVGNPASIVGYTNTSARAGDAPAELRGVAADSVVPGVRLIPLPIYSDMRGRLNVAEFEREVPFVPKRYFTVFDVPSRETRGEHAHRQCHQFLICIRGSCTAVADNGSVRQEFLLDSCERGLYMPPMIWGTQYKYSAESMLLVFASHYYDPADYIRDYGAFLVENGAHSTQPQ